MVYAVAKTVAKAFAMVLASVKGEGSKSVRLTIGFWTVVFS